MREVDPAPPEFLAEARARTDALLEACAARLAQEHAPPLGDAVAYALRTTGKRVRPALVFACYYSVGGDAPAIAGVAAAVEIVHTYSLVHDDLPCMDDDDQRRGRPTTHRAFDVATATRAGCLLVPVAVEELARAAAALGLQPAILGGMARVLLRAGGLEGMIAGQWMDLEAEARPVTLEELRRVHRAKTGALIEASCVLGALAGRATDRQREALAAFGRDIGLAFQIADDVLDATGTTAELGKTAGRDASLEKSTYVRLLGVEGARDAAQRQAALAVRHLEGGDVAGETLAQLARYIVTRSS